ncbi:exosome complex protein Rrp42 [archaeon]|jgi:exosome complex component RRP42|nr:exosome complex protein Rrp42 [archaeon]MBT3731412.1 exosome complex protein Rrp42 [archaeon]MBT4670285.1 exosome complex protein Rrp42 [archaeon]MBT5029697.1 exosome complex protein Rrp42 [archaeon]MBT5287554.1 exosome complex protein Rrp42 [archaeon]
MITEEYVQSLSKLGKRMDGRKFDEYRNLSIEYGISKKSAEGSARVKIGETEVIAGVKLDLGEPYPDKPDQGSIMVNVELTPLSSAKYESGPPNINAIELSRVTDRGIRECGAIDFKRLYDKASGKVWLVFIDIYPINSAGNLFDACTIAAMAAIRDAVFPSIENGKVDYSTKTKTPLPLQKLPISCTVWKVGNELLVDPSVEEESASNSRITVVFTEDDKICAMQKGKDEPLLADEIEKAVELAFKTTKDIRGHFKK